MICFKEGAIVDRGIEANVLQEKCVMMMEV